MTDDQTLSKDLGMPRLTLHPLQKIRYSIPRLGTVRGILWRMEIPNAPATYAIELKGMGYRRLRVIGRDPFAARKLFALLAKHTVTPFGLADVADEWT